MRIHKPNGLKTNIKKLKKGVCQKYSIGMAICNKGRDDGKVQRM